MPAQKGDDQAQLARTIFSTVTPFVEADAIEGRRDVWGLLQAQPFAEVHGAAAKHGLGEGSAPSAEILGAD